MHGETAREGAKEGRVDHAAPMPFALALAPILALAGSLIWLWSETGQLGGEAVLSALLFSAVLAAILARVRGQQFSALQACVARDLGSVVPVLLILLSIGVLVGAWMLSGTIPVLIYLGLKSVVAEHFLVTAFFATALMSLCTGTSWGSAASLGVALMGIATVIDAPLPASAGAVVSGAYFGDKLSPLSDSTNICALAARCPLPRHIRALLHTSLPATLAALICFAWLDAHHSQATWSAQSLELLRELESFCHPHWSAALPVVAVLVAVWRRLAPCPAMLLSAASALPVATLSHGIAFADASRALISGFKLEMLPRAQQAISAGTGPSQDLIALLERGGLLSLSSALPLVILAFSFTAGLKVSGALSTLLAQLGKLAVSRLGLVLSTMVSGILMIALTSHGGVSALFVGELFQDNYRNHQLHAANLSRCLEESITVIDPLLPWTVSGIFMAQTLGVPTLDYAPFAVFAWLSPLFSIVLATYDQWRGRGLIRSTRPHG